METKTSSSPTPCQNCVAFFVWETSLAVYQQITISEIDDTSFAISSGSPSFITNPQTIFFHGALSGEGHETRLSILWELHGSIQVELQPWISY